MASTSSSHQQNAFSKIGPPNKRREVEESSRVYDVFINHRGPDVKLTLATQLYDSLKDLHIKAFLDSEEKEVGDSFPSTIEAAIRSASVHIAIFSEKYAESNWCLDELVLMLKSRAKIIPVFYKVEPSALRYIEKGVYAEAFLEYKNKGRYLDKLEAWKEALQQVSYIAGCEFKNSDSSDCKDIVSAVEKEVKRTERLHVAKHPVGIHKFVQDFERRCLDEFVQDFENQCRMEKAAKQRANVVGIFGMGGVGKTTLSKEFFNRKRLKYTRASFLFDVREAYASRKLPSLQSKLVKDLFCEDHSFLSDQEGTSHLRDRLERNSSFSFLIVLDDIDHAEQLDALLPMDILNKPGNNLVVVTTRDVGVLVNARIDIAYHLKGLDREDGRELFCWYAFNKPLPVSGYEDLVEAFVNKCGGLPLSIIVLGRHVCSRSQCYWQDALEKLKDTLPREIKQRLKISIDTLDNAEKKIFMDIACFFIGKSITEAMTIWEGSGWSARHALRTLKEKCLVEESYLNALQYKWESSLGGSAFRMHDHLRDMGREMADELSHPRRVWRPQDLRSLELKGFIDILAQTKGRCFHSILDKSIGCNITYFLREPQVGSDTSLLWLQLEYLSFPELDLNSDINSSIFSWIPLQNLQCLRISNGCFQKLWQSDVQVPSHLKELQIHDTFLEEFPDFSGKFNKMEKLVLHADDIQTDIMLPTTLIELDVQNCRHLRKIGGAGDLTKLKRLIVKQCPALEEWQSLARVSCLEELEIRFCEKLQNIMLPTTLIKLDVCNCGGLRKIAGAGDLTELKRLIIGACPALEELSILARVSCLEEINIWLCEKLQNIMLPTTLIILKVHNCGHLRKIEAGDLTELTELRIAECPALEELPSLARVSCLEELKIRFCEKLPNIMLPTTLIKLDVESCGDLRKIGGAGDLTELSIAGCPALEELPSLARVSCLEKIGIDSCEKLQNIMLPKTLINLGVSNCGGLRKIAGAGDLTELKRLIIVDCPPLEELPSLPRVGCLEEIKILFCEKLQNIMLPTTLIKLKVHGCRDLKKIAGAGNLTELTELRIAECPALKELPSLAKVSWLKSMKIDSCEKLQIIAIGGAGDLTELTELSITECPALEELPSLAKVSCLKSMKIDSCEKLQIIAGIEELHVSGDIELIELSYCGNAVIRNWFHKLKSVPTIMIGRAADGAESLFSDGDIGVDGVIDIGTHETSPEWSEVSAVIRWYVVVVDGSTPVEDINESLWTFYYSVIPMREGKWIITTVACDVASYNHLAGFHHWLRNIEEGILKKEYRVEVKKGEEGKSVGVLRTVVDRLYYS